MSAPTTKRAGNRGASLFAAVGAIKAAAPLSTKVWTAPTVTAQRAFDLRTRLAVRGWANPQSLFDPNERDADFDTALCVVAEEVETLASAHPGCWYYKGQNRQRVLADRGRPAILAELGTFRCGADAVDPVRRALRMVFDLDPLPQLAELELEVVKALGPARAWLGNAFDTPENRAAIAAELSRRERAADVARLTSGALVGAAREAAFATLHAEISRPFDPAAPLTISYVHGCGGAGKSTLIASLVKAVRDVEPMPLLLRMDFDDRRLDPFDPFALDLGFFEQLRIALPDAVKSILGPTRMLRRMRRERRSTRMAAGSPSGKRAMASESFAGGESLAEEGSTAYEKSERDSVLHGFLAPGGRVVPPVPVLLMLDTLEVATARGDAAVAELVDWLDSLWRSLGCADLRVFIAGRDPPTSGSADVASLLVARGHRRGVVIPVGELTIPEIETLLRQCGIQDDNLVAAAAAVLPGNPLLIRTAAEALLLPGDASENSRAAYRNGEIDRVAASAYLMKRIVAHVADPGARPYLLPAMYLPAVTPAVLANVVMPETDRLRVAGLALMPAPAASPAEAERIFAAFRAARWLTRAADDERQVRFHDDLRELVLRLLHADKAVQAPLEAAIRVRAIAWHGRRTSAEHRAWRFYHAAMGGEIDVPRNAAETLAILAPVIGDLPPTAHEALLLAATQAPAVPRATRSVDEVERAGARLVKRDRGADALELYRVQSPHDTIPTFAIQALADSGDWHSGEVDVEALLAEFDGTSGRRLSNDRLSRLYWLTRFVLLRDGGRIGDHHAAVLRAAAAPLANLAGFSALPPLVGVAEAGLASGAAPIAPRSWLAPATGSFTARLMLVRSLRRDQARAEAATRVRLRADDLAIAQRDWARRLSAVPVSLKEANVIQSIVNQIDGDGFGAVGLKLGVLAKRSAVEVPLDIPPAGQVLLLRGLTTEFLRPLTHALCHWHGDPAAAPIVLDIMLEVVAAMSVRPREFAPEVFSEMLLIDPRAWVAALVGYADRCRLLPLLCTRIIGTAGAEPAAALCGTVATSFLAWDRNLCVGRTSDWTEVQSQTDPS